MAEPGKDKVLVIPCSGIGKVYGLMAREIAFEVADRLAPEAAETLCLALLVKGEEEAVRAVQTRPCVTVDGCAKLCSFKNVELAGGTIAHSLRVVDAFRDRKGAQPGTATALEADGWTISCELAEGLLAEVAACQAGEEQ